MDRMSKTSTTSADPVTLSSSTIFPANTTDLSSGEDGPEEWYTFVEIVLLGIISAFGLIGNLLILRNAAVDITRFAQQNVILFCSLAIGDLVVSALRGPLLIYFLTQEDGDQNDAICEIWMVSTVFIAITLLTNTVLAIQRVFIMFCYSKYKKKFTFKNILIVIVGFWIFFPTASIAIYKSLQEDAFFTVSHHVCVLVYNKITFNLDYFTVVRCLLVCIFGYIPICIITICYYLIYIRIKKSGLKKLDQIVRNLNFARVILLSGVRVSLMLSLLTPFFMMLILAPLYPGALLPCMRYLDYLLILYSAISPIVTLNDADFKDSKGRRAWLSAHFGGANNGVFHKRNEEDLQDRGISMCITSADLKCYKITE